MALEGEKLFWKKKEYLSFLLSILVLFIHSYFAQGSGESIISVINHKVSYFFSVSITRFAVPMFFLLSGITFFKGYDNKKYPAKIKSRLFTLVIPYLLWNTIWMLWEIFTSNTFVAKIIGEATPYPLNLTSILKGVFFYGCNDPFWFVFDLIIFSFAAPIVFQIIKNKYVGIIAIAGLTVLSLFGIHLPEQVFYSPISIIFYMIGAVIGYHFFGLACEKSSKPRRIFSVIFLTAYILAKNIAPQEIHIDNYLIQTLVYTVAAFSLWCIADIFIEKVKPRAIHQRSFAIYAMHLHVAIIILKVLSIVLPQSEWLEIPKFAIMVVSTLALINLACAILEKLTPKIYATLMGNRINKKQ